MAKRYADFAGAIEEPILGRAFAYWNRLRQDRNAPARRDINPADITGILPYLVLNDVIPENPVRYRYRLVGTRVVDYYGIDPTGRFLDDVTKGEFYRSVTEAFEHCCSTMRPAVERIDNVWQAPCSYMRLILPLSDDDATVNIIMVCVIGEIELRNPNPLRSLFKDS